MSEALISPERFLKTSELIDAWGLNMVIFGPPGVGKTTLCATAQDSEFGKDVLYIDIEGGTRSIADKEGITVFRPNGLADLVNIHQWLTTSEHSFKTIVMDSITEAQRLILNEVLKTSKTPDMPGLQDYGKTNEQLVKMIRVYRELSQTRGWNVIFTALATEQKDESTGAVLVRPALFPKASEGITGAVDAVGYMTFTQDGQRVLRLQGTSSLIAKVRQPQTGPQLPDQLENPSLGALLDFMKGKVAA